MSKLCEHVRNVTDEALHDLDPARVRARKRLHAMLERCANTTEYDFACERCHYARPVKPKRDLWSMFPPVEWRELPGKSVEPISL